MHQWERPQSHCEYMYRFYPQQALSHISVTHSGPLAHNVIMSWLIMSHSQSFQCSIWQHAPVDHCGAVCAAASSDSSPHAGLPQSGSEVGGADEEGGRTHRCDRHSEEGQLQTFTSTSVHVRNAPEHLFCFSGHSYLLLPDCGDSAVFGSHFPHPVLHTGTQGVR